MEFVVGAVWFLMLTAAFHMAFGGAARLLHGRRRRRAARAVPVRLPLSRRSPD